MENETNQEARLPIPKDTQIDAGKWRVLCESIFPAAKTPDAILMAIDYCKARKLDIMKRPVHIVPMWSTQKGCYVETVWPSITEVQTTAARTKQYAGIDSPQFGNIKKTEFKGKLKNNVGDTTVTVEHPEWCAVTVYRMIDGVRCAFTEPVYWLEAYGRIGKTELPNDQWQKRPMGMIIKVAKAFSLRAAFPEEGEHTAEEMEGRNFEEATANGVVIDNSEFNKKKPAFKNAALRKVYCENCIESYEKAESIEHLNEIANMNKEKLKEMAESGNEHDALAAEEIDKQYNICLMKLKNNKPSEADVDDYLTKEFDARFGV
ncbi:MAG: phage recombination protein Bet [Burkholderiaceae bacterium]